MERGEVVGLINLAIEDGHVPVVHPNGFIQLKLPDNRRMHFWDKSIPRQKTASPIHDHVFDMDSEIVAGTLLHCEIRVHSEPDGFYDLYEAVTVEGVETKLVPLQNRVRADYGEWQEFHAGDEYMFPAGRFHETSDRLGPAISIITKGQTFTTFNPRVLVKHGEKPDNDFERGSFTLVKLLDTISRITSELFPKNNVVKGAK